jgi:hypothetical protein
MLSILNTSLSLRADFHQLADEISLDFLPVIDFRPDLLFLFTNPRGFLDS